MKKNLWIWAIAALTMAACTSEDVPTAQVTENDWESPDGRVLVQLSAEGLPEPTVSLGRAAITGTDISALENLGIFALARGAASYNANTNSGILLKNVIAKGTDATTLDEDLHTTIDENGQEVPLKRIRLYESEENKTAGKASIYYYPIKPDYNYDFYGYHPRQTNVIYGNDVFVTFAATDGSMDIITGRQESVAPTMVAHSLFVNEATENNTNEEPINGFNSKYIRSIKYHNWLLDEGKQSGKEKQRFVPNIKFNHRTALLNFYVVANDKQAGEPDDPTTPDEDEAYNDQYKATKLRVFDLYMLNVNRVATWSVISDEINWSTPENLKVCKFEANAADPTVWETKTIKIVDANGNVTSTRNNVATIIPAENKDVAKQAGYMLVEPKKDYQIKLSVLAPGTDVEGNGKIIPEWQETTLTIPTQLEAGHSYNVYIQLNALQEVNIHAELVGWIEEEKDIDIPVE